MNEQIKAGSKLLAEFEGYTVENETVRNKGIYNWHLSECSYHTDYNELMRVVHKAYDVADVDTKQYGGFQVFELGLASPKEEIFEACVKFAEWYNSLKPKS